MSYNSPFTGAQVDDAVSKRHEQNTDTKLDEGGANEVTAEEARDHIDATDNPHSVTKAQVGLGNVTNDAQLKIASNLSDLTFPSDARANLGLGNVNNVSAADLRDRSTHTGTQTLATISDAGTAATADVTTSATDTTAGRLLKVGDFGVGENAALVLPMTDLNATGLAGGFYRVQSSLDIVNFSGVGFVASHNSGAKGILSCQVGGGTNPSIEYRNSGGDGVLSDAVQLYHTGNLLGTVSQSSGVPTGAVIERGSNSNGEYVRFADGTQIATSEERSYTSVAGEVGSIYRSGSQNFNLPIGFVEPPVAYITFTESPGEGTGFWPGFNPTTATGPAHTTTQVRNVSIYSPDSRNFDASTPLKCRAVAIGRWF